jgi:YD repeat-containing protein
MDLTKVKYCKVHPAIGLARVGGSAEGYFIGPEVPNYDGTPPAGGWKDKDGQLLRQVARFRIYGYDESGNVVGEVTPGGSVELTWRVHVANHKAAWYDFDEAMDIPAFDGSQGTPPKQSGLRNSAVADRAQLVNDPGPREIAGKNTKGKKYAFTGGKCFGIEVPLGELRTDEEGRLLFLVRTATPPRPRKSRRRPSRTTTAGTTTSPTVLSRRRSPSPASRCRSSMAGSWSRRRTMRRA